MCFRVTKTMVSAALLPIPDLSYKSELWLSLVTIGASGWYWRNRIVGKIFLQGICASPASDLIVKKFTISLFTAQVLILLVPGYPEAHFYFFSNTAYFGE